MNVADALQERLGQEKEWVTPTPLNHDQVYMNVYILCPLKVSEN